MDVSPGSISLFVLGVAVLVFGVRVRNGMGAARVSRGIRIRYAEVPSVVRSRAGNASIVLGSIILVLAICTLFPGPIMLVPIVAWILLVYPYYLRAKELQDSVKMIADQGSLR